MRNEEKLSSFDLFSRSKKIRYIIGDSITKIYREICKTEGEDFISEENFLKEAEITLEVLKRELAE